MDVMSDNPNCANGHSMTVMKWHHQNLPHGRSDRTRIDKVKLGIGEKHRDIGVQYHAAWAELPRHCGTRGVAQLTGYRLPSKEVAISFAFQDAQPCGLSPAQLESNLDYSLQYILGRNRRLASQLRHFRFEVVGGILAPESLAQFVGDLHLGQAQLKLFLHEGLLRESRQMSEMMVAPQAS